MLPVLTGMPTPARRTLTWDQGSEMACHDQLAEFFADGIFFAHPGSPWLRGSNENTNGLLRQYFAKGSDLRAFSLADLRAVEQRLNERPRKRLGWRSPAQAMTAELAS
jgi:IS30 family transposase